MGVVVGVDVENKSRTQYTEVYRDIAVTRLYFCESSARSISSKKVKVNIPVKNIWNWRLSRNIDIDVGDVVVDVDVHDVENTKSLRIIIWKWKCKKFLELPT